MTLVRTLRHLIASPWREWWDERAALMQYDGGLERKAAEEEALRCVQVYAQTHTPLDYSREGKVYILHEEGTLSYKIGRSWSPMNRKKELQTGTAQTLHILREIYHRDCLTLERSLHKRYARYKIHSEWFALPADVLTALLKEEFV